MVEKMSKDDLAKAPAFDELDTGEEKKSLLGQAAKGKNVKEETQQGSKVPSPVPTVSPSVPSTTSEHKPHRKEKKKHHK